MNLYIKIAVCLFLSVIFTSCTHRISRSNYIQHQGEFSRCNVVFKQKIMSGDSIQKVGLVELMDSQFSVKCNEAHALKLLEKEACALNADVVNIIEEKRPGIGSSCYRCKAEIYKYTKGKTELKSDDYYNKDELDKRLKKDKNKNTVFLYSSIVLGLIIAAFIFTL